MHILPAHGALGIFTETETPRLWRTSDGTASLSKRQVMAAAPADNSVLSSVSAPYTVGSAAGRQATSTAAVAGRRPWCNYMRPDCARHAFLQAKEW